MPGIQKWINHSPHASILIYSLRGKKIDGNIDIRLVDFWFRFVIYFFSLHKSLRYANGIGDGIPANIGPEEHIVDKFFDCEIMDTIQICI